MKTTIRIEVQTSDDLKVYPEEKLYNDDFEDYKNTLEAEQDLENYKKDLHDKVVYSILEYFKRPKMGQNFINSPAEEQILDDLEECYVEGMESVDSYGIKLKVLNKGHGE